MSIPNYSQVVRTTGGVETKRAVINCNSNAAAGNELIAAVTGKKICVLSMTLVAAGAVTATFYSDAANAAGPIAIRGPMALAANVGLRESAPATPECHEIETRAGKSLVLLLSAAVQVGGSILYYEE